MIAPRRSPSRSSPPPPRTRRERVETALALLASRYREGRSGIVLEQVAGGYAFRAAQGGGGGVRAARRAARAARALAGRARDARDRRLPRPGLRPEIARMRGVAADSAVAGLVERGLVAEAGRDKEGGAIRYETTPLFERVFGLAGCPSSPRLDDLGRATARAPPAPRRSRRAQRRLTPSDDRFGLFAREGAESLGAHVPCRVSSRTIRRPSRRSAPRRSRRRRSGRA